MVVFNNLYEKKVALKEKLAEAVSVAGPNANLHPIVFQYAGMQVGMCFDPSGSLAAGQSFELANGNEFGTVIIAVNNSIIKNELNQQRAMAAIEDSHSIEELEVLVSQRIQGMSPEKQQAYSEISWGEIAYDILDGPEDKDFQSQESIMAMLDNDKQHEWFQAASDRYELLVSPSMRP